MSAANRPTARRGLAPLGTAVASLSPVVVALVIAPFVPAGEIGALAAVLGLTLVLGILPAVVQTAAARCRTERGASTDVPWQPVNAALVAGALAAPVLATALELPIVAVLLPFVAVVPAVLVAVGRGELIALGHHHRVARDRLVEGGVLAVLGIALGIAIGPAGVAGAVLAASVVSLLTLRYPRASTSEELRFPPGAAALAVVAVAANLDALLGARLLDDAAADSFGLAVIAGKSLLLLLVLRAADARGVESGGRPVQLVRTVASGIAGAAVVAVALPVVAGVLGGPVPNRLVLVMLGVGMAANAGIRSCFTVEAATGASRWSVVASAVAVVGTGAVLVAPAGDRATTHLAMAVLVGQLAALVAGAAVLHLATMREALQAKARSRADRTAAPATRRLSARNPAAAPTPASTVAPSPSVPAPAPASLAMGSLPPPPAVPLPAPAPVVSPVASVPVAVAPLPPPPVVFAPGPSALLPPPVVSVPVPSAPLPPPPAVRPVTAVASAAGRTSRRAQARAAVRSATRAARRVTPEPAAIPVLPAPAADDVVIDLRGPVAVVTSGGCPESALASLPPPPVAAVPHAPLRATPAFPRHLLAAAAAAGAERTEDAPPPDERSAEPVGADRGPRFL